MFENPFGFGSERLDVTGDGFVRDGVVPLADLGSDRDVFQELAARSGGAIGEAEFSVIRAMSEVQGLLAELGDRPDFDFILGTALETSPNNPEAARLWAEYEAGNFTDTPAIEIVADSYLGQAPAAYAIETDTVYVSEGLAQSGNFDRITGVLIEEVGHALDARLNAVDAPGDEGEIFSALVRGESLTNDRLAELKSEDDTAQIEIDGQLLAIEQASVGGSGGAEGSRETLNLGASGGVPLAIQYSMRTIPDRLIVRYEGRNIVDTGFVSGSQSLKVNVPSGQSDTVSVVLATNDAATLWDYSVNTDISSLPPTGEAGPGDPVQPVPTESRDVTAEKRNEETGCQDCKATVPGTSEVELHSGAVVEMHDLVPYQSLGGVRGLTLQYDSLRADPSQIVYFGFE